jgi:hypothetical protein
MESSRRKYLHFCRSHQPEGGSRRTPSPACSIADGRLQESEKMHEMNWRRCPCRALDTVETQHRVLHSFDAGMTHGPGRRT